MKPADIDAQMMQRALALATRGLFTSKPNPRVGCVLLKQDEVVGEGWHERAGEAHAEVHALRAAGEAARGATAYVTLEPCAHQGRTGPCADALIAAGVSRVVLAMRDPNPLVNGQGTARLRAAGIEVLEGVCRQEAMDLNAGFVSRMQRGRPLLRAKIAMSLDARIALASGESKWISNAGAREDVQRWRAQSCVLMTGIGTVLADDPQMNVRLDAPHVPPLRVVLDRAARLPPGARLLQDAAPVLLACAAHADAGRVQVLEARGVQVFKVDARDDADFLQQLLAHLGSLGKNEILLESGSTLLAAAANADLVDELLLYQAPCLLGTDAQPAFAIASPALLAERQKLALLECKALGDNLRLRYRLQEPAH
jgi:diaminohydroxyphosphoribosylaminopyrimidine deaminase / 5-amino-6-(5-phosphoribosylamino)uracil reductase